jgi:hypothetical protein
LINAATLARSTHNQRHTLRPDACDIGAVEYSPYALDLSLIQR